jgi:hypothetical protein
MFLSVQMGITNSCHSIRTLPRALKLDTLVDTIDAVPMMTIINMLPTVTVVTAFWQLC